MKLYTIQISPEVDKDIDNVYNYIAHKLMAPMTAIAYRNGIYDTIKRLETIGGVLAINQRKHLQRNYGPGARTITYKRMIIVFNVIDNVILIRRVIAGQMVL
jgi:plasmid stabilization system protein ParE